MRNNTIMLTRKNLKPMQNSKDEMNKLIKLLRDYEFSVITIYCDGYEEYYNIKPHGILRYFFIPLNLGKQIIRFFNFVWEFRYSNIKVFICRHFAKFKSERK